MLSLLNIDKAYVIHMKESKEREKNIDEIRKLFPSLEVFDAVRGDSIDRKDPVISPRVMLDMMTGRCRHEGIISMGAIGCYLSHYYIWLEVIKRGYDRVLIFEDDAVIPKDFEERVREENIGELDYDILLLGGYNRCSEGKLLKDRFIGCYSYIITKEAIKSMLKYALPISMHLDAFCGLMIKINGMKAYAFSIVDYDRKYTSQTGGDKRDRIVYDDCKKDSDSQKIMICLFLFILLLIYLL